MGSPALFSGTFVKLLKSKINLFDTAFILTGTDDPTSVAQNAPKGSLYLRQGTVGELYIKEDNGSSTNWNIVPIGMTVNQDRNLKLIEGGTWGYSSTPPSTLISNLTSTNLLFTLNTPGGGSPNTAVGQSYTAPSSFVITEILVGLQRGGSPSGNVKLAIYDDNAGNPGTILGYSDEIVASSISTSPADYTFTFPTSIVNLSGGIYYFQLVPGTGYSGSDANSIGTVGIYSDVFAGGEVRYFNGGMWQTFVGDTRFTISGYSQELSWTDDAYIQVPGFLNNRNTIQSSESPQPLFEGQVAYVALNRDTDSLTNLTVSVDNVENIDETDPNILIIARGVSGGAIIGTHSTLLRAGQSTVIDGVTNDGEVLDKKLFSWFEDSLYNFMTPVIVAQTGGDLISSSSTGSFGTESTFDIDNTEFLLSNQLFDADFLSDLATPDRVQLMLAWDPSAIDTGATYQVSRNGGNDYQTITMERIGESPVFVGSHIFTDEAGEILLTGGVGAGVGVGLEDTTGGSGQQWVAKKFTLTDYALIQGATFDIQKDGTPEGYVWCEIRTDSAGAPSALESGVIRQSNYVAANDFPANWDTTLTTFDLGDMVLAPGDYHMVVRADAAYKARYTATAGASQVRLDAGFGGDTSGYNRWNGTAWNSFSIRIEFDLSGFYLDLRVKVTSSGAAKKIKGFGVAYDYNASSVTGITDTIRKLIEDNHLGSTDPDVDQSVVGRGIFLRRPDGTLREIAIDDSDNIVVYSV